MENKVCTVGRLDFLFDELRRVGVLGIKSNNSADILFKSKSCVLLRYLSKDGSKKVFCTVIRSSRQCYKVIAFSTLDTAGLKTVSEFIKSFRNYADTAACLKNLFKEVC